MFLDCGSLQGLDEKAIREVKYEIVIHIEAERNSPQVDRPARKVLRIYAKESNKNKDATKDAKGISTNKLLAARIEAIIVKADMQEVTS